MVNASIGFITVLDHAEVELQLLLTDRSAVSNYWRLNTSLLNDYKFEVFILKELKNFTELNQSTASFASVLWEATKVSL